MGTRSLAGNLLYRNLMREWPLDTEVLDKIVRRYGRVIGHRSPHHVKIRYESGHSAIVSVADLVMI